MWTVTWQQCRHLSIKRQKASVTCVTNDLNSLLIWFAKYCYVNVFLIATVLYQKLRQVLQITAKVEEQIIKRFFFSFPLSNQKREGKIAYQKLKTIYIYQEHSKQGYLYARTVRTCVPEKVEGEKNNNEIRYKSE